MGIRSLLSTSTTIEIVSIVVTIICLASFCVVFTILFRKYYKHNIEDVKAGKDDIELIDNALHIEQDKKKKSKKVLRIIGQVVSWTLLGVVVVGFGFALASRISNNNILIGDSNYIVIASGSMSECNEANTYLKDNNLTNQIKTYDMVQIKKVEAKEDIKLYDVIAFKDKANRTIVHRVIDIDENHTFITRGDAVGASDSNQLYGSRLTFDKVVGRYTGSRIPVIGIFVVFLQSNAGIITVISVVYCMVMFDYFKRVYDKEVSNRTKMLIETINYDMRKKEADDVYSHFSQSIIYKGETYLFEDGNFISKNKSSEDVKNDNDENQMIVIKNEDGNEVSEIRNVEVEVPSIKDKKDDNKMN